MIKARLSFPRHLGFRMPSDGKFRVSLELARETVLGLRVAFQVGYNPQMLLPAPRDFKVDPLFTAEMLAGVNFASLSDLFLKHAPPTRYEIEGGHFDMQDPGTIDLDGEMIEFSLMERREPTFKHKIAIIPMDYSFSEARVLATLADKRVRGMTIDLDSPGGELDGRRYFPTPVEKPDFSQVREKTKQNGRSAEYLKRGGFANNKRYRK